MQVHFDMTMFAYEKLAPQGTGWIPLRYRRVPCWWQPEVPAPPSPDPKKTVFAANTGAPPPGTANPMRGWDWIPYAPDWVKRIWAVSLPCLVMYLSSGQP